jgi:dihydroflavonol-4-reductase
MPETAPTLLTGATGFVGAAVARTLLARGHQLRLLVRPGSDRRNIEGLPAELAEGDLTRPETLARAAEGCRYLFHVAADYRLWVPDPDAMMRANVEGTRALLLAAQSRGVERMVYCSSVAALGLVGDGTVADETTPVHPDKIVGVYKRSKYLAEQAVLDLVRDHAMPVVIVNPSTPIGPRDIKPTPTGQMIHDAARGRLPAYVETGLNIVHVDDVAEGHALALERGRIGERYILGGEDFSLGALFALVAEAAGRKPPSVKLPIGPLYPLAVVCEGLARLGVEPLLTRETLAMARKKMFFSSAKARAELGYSPRPARDAVRDAVAWFSTGAAGS